MKQRQQRQRDDAEHDAHAEDGAPTHVVDERSADARGEHRDEDHHGRQVREHSIRVLSAVHVVDHGPRQRQRSRAAGRLDDAPQHQPVGRRRAERKQAAGTEERRPDEDDRTPAMAVRQRAVDQGRHGDGHEREADQGLCRRHRHGEVPMHEGHGRRDDLRCQRAERVSGDEGDQGDGVESLHGGSPLVSHGQVGASDDREPTETMSLDDFREPAICTSLFRPCRGLLRRADSQAARQCPGAARPDRSACA